MRKFLAVLCLGAMCGCAIPSSYQTKLQLPDGSTLATPKDGDIRNIKLDKIAVAKDGSRQETHFSADQIHYGINSNATSTEAAIYRQLLPNGIDGAINATGNAVGQGIGAAVKTAIKP